MTGSFPEGIQQLSFLQTLKLMGNELTGPLPTQVLSKMKNLSELELSYNQFTGTIPSAWYHSGSTLKGMTLTGNRLGGSISPDIQNLSHLRWLKLGHNLLKDSIPTEIGQLSQLYSLRLNSNFLTGTIPTQLGQVHLVYLALFENRLSGTIPPQLGVPGRLEDLQVHMNAQLGGALPVEIFPRLSRLDAYACNFTQDLTNFWSEAFPVGTVGKWLHDMRLDDNRFRGRLPDNFGQIFPHLDKLWLSGTDLTGSMPASFCKRRSTRRILWEVVADCGASTTASPEISCPDDCCTICCDEAGVNCMPTDY